MYVIETAKENQIAISLEAKLLQQGIIIIDSEINKELTLDVKNQFLYLMSLPSVKKISLYINSEGGVIYSGLAIYDMMNLAKSKGIIVETVCTGIAMSMGLVLLINGTKGHRYSLPSATLMAHQASGGAWGTTLDFNIRAKELNRLNNLMAKIVEENSNITDYKEMCQRDCFYDTKQALELGLIDKLL